MSLSKPNVKSTVISSGTIRSLTEQVNKMTTTHMLSNAYHNHDRKALEEMQQELIKERMVLGAFMTKFLDKFERKMKPDRIDTPIWDMYHNKMREYNRLDGLIKVSQYYLEHTNV